MPVDEFGREILADARQRRRSGSPRSGSNDAALASYQPTAPSYFQSGPYHPANNNSSAQPRSSSSNSNSAIEEVPTSVVAAERAPLYHSRGPPHGGPPPPPPPPHHHHHLHHHGGGGRGGRGSGGYYRGSGSGGRGSPTWRQQQQQQQQPRPYGSYGPPQQSSSYYGNNKPPFGGGGRRDNHPHHPHHHSQQLLQATTPAQPHPSIRYIVAPMLCGYLWKQENKNDAQAEENKSASEQQQLPRDEQNGSTEETEIKDEEKTSENGTKGEKQAMTNDNAPTNNDESNNENQSHKMQEEDQEEQIKAYTAYRRSYCGNYLKHVFNAHLDDSWFRQLFSPLSRYEAAMAERQRAQTEARYLTEEVTTWQANPLKNITLTTTLSLTVRETPRYAPRFHVPRAVQEGWLLQVKEVPSHVTNTQLWHALPAASKWIHVAPSPPPDLDSKHNAAPTTPYAVLQLISSMPAQTHHTRTVYWQCPNRATCDALWQAFLADDGRNNASSPDTATTTIAWEVDCQDPYRRTEYDVDGRGGAPEDGLGVPDRKAVLQVSLYNDVTAVSVLSMALSQPSRIPEDARAATTLARALDVQQHVPSHHQLDALLETAESSLFTTEALEGEEGADVQALRLDLTLAYLRRVHGVNFYKGCQRADFFGDILAGGEAASSLQCRLSISQEEQEEDDAAAAAMASGESVVKEEDETNIKREDEDKINEEESEEKPSEVEGGEKETKEVGSSMVPPPSPVKDLLVQRLDDAIQQALNVTCHEWIAAADAIVDATTDAAAEDLRRAEEVAEEDWLRHHSIDDEGRARCSFHFCHKLFKDENFLRKHLKKKHYEYCKAEQAKCHDTYMMKAWEGAGASRPRLLSSSSAVGPPRLIVPDILVDCGTKYGCIPAPLYHVFKKKDTYEQLVNDEGEYEEEEDIRNDVVIVDVVDPEPALWQKEQEEERIEREKRRAAEEARARRREESRQQRMVPSLTPRKKEFVDVDDMKEEEVVTMTFDQVELPQPKKKKKKRKLL